MDDTAEIAKIEKNGNKPEEWLDFIRRVKRESPKYSYLMSLYDQAGRTISPNENRKNVSYARLLVEYAKLQGMNSADEARETFRIARCNVKRFAIVYIAWAQFELDKGNREKCRTHLVKGKANRAEPSDILDQALRSYDQVNDRLLDDETEELIFTGVVTQTVKTGLPLPTLMSDSELTSEKIGEDNTTDIAPSKSDTGDFVSFKLPYSADNNSKQRQKLMSSGSSSGEDTVTAPFHSILKANRSMSTRKPSLKATPDCRNVGSKSLSNSMNLSARKPRVGIGKNFLFLGLPVRGKPTQSLEEVKEPTNDVEEEDIMDSFKAIEHTTEITSENYKQNVNSSEKSTPNTSIDSREKLKLEDCNSDIISCNKEHPNKASLLETMLKTNQETQVTNHCNSDVPITGNHGNPDSTSTDKQIDTKHVNMCNNSASGNNRSAVNTTINTPDIPILEHQLPINQPSIVNQGLHISQSNTAINNGSNIQASDKQKQPISQDVPMLDDKSLPNQPGSTNQGLASNMYPDHVSNGHNIQHIEKTTQPNQDVPILDSKLQPNQPCSTNQGLASNMFPDHVSNGHNVQHIEKTTQPNQDVPILDSKLQPNQPCSTNQGLASNMYPDHVSNGHNVQHIEKTTQPNQDVPMSRNYSDYASAKNPAPGQDIQMANSQSKPGMPNHPLANKVATGAHGVQELAPSENQLPNHIVGTQGYPKKANHESQGFPITKAHLNNYNASRSNQGHPRHVMGDKVDSQRQSDKSSSFLPNNVPSFQNSASNVQYNQFYPPPQASVGNSNILVNGKSYLKLGTIGRGGSSKVFRAFDGKRVCAVKYVSLENADDFIVQSYINEIAMLKRLQGSDYIVKLYDWEQKKDENSIIIVLECGSIDLAVFLRKNRSTFTETELTAYWKQMLEAVNVIHNEGIIHSDLKPANFLFIEGRLKLIDFGIANAIQADQTSIQRDTQVGTLNFMSPEAFQDISGSSQMNTNPCTPKPCTKIGRPSDVWSLGCILYNMVYGRTPFQHITNQAMKLQCIIDESHAIEFPPINNPQLLDVLKGSLIRNPRDRYTIPHLLTHPFLCSGNQGTEPNEEQLFNCLLELAQAHVNSPRSIRIASKSICEQLRSGNKIDLSSFLAKKQQQSQLASRSLRQPLGGLSVDALQYAHSSMKPSTTAYKGNERPYFDKENADLPFKG